MPINRSRGRIALGVGWLRYLPGGLHGEATRCYLRPPCLEDGL